MNTLKILQTTNDGRRKTWKLNSSSELMTFGSSRKARLVSIDNAVGNIESVFEYRNNRWHYITFSLNCESADYAIEKNKTIQLNNSTLHFEILEKKQNLFTKIEHLNLFGTQDKKFILISQKKSLISTHISDLNEDFQFYMSGQVHILTLPATDKWNFQKFSEFDIKYKKISVADLKVYENSTQKNFNKKDRATVLSVLGFTAMLIFISLFVPNNPKTEPVVQSKTATTIIVKNEFKKRQRTQSESAASPQEIAKNHTPSQNSTSKISALLKGAVGARISQLIGKVSATEARTKNVLVTTSGVKASESSSGRALTAIGKVESSGRNWNGETTAAGTGISTLGIGGGKSAGGLGGALGQGKTGSGGVGLIEEESEIVGGLDREIIAQYIKTQLGQILYCYERQLSANPNLFGKVAVKFTIAGTGQVETQAINDSTMKNLSVESCILNKISKWKFPEPKGGTKVLVTYPFLFKSTI